MSKVETLTEYQESQIIPHREFWLNYILSCKNKTDKEKAKEGINWLYKYCKKDPPIIIFMDSPFGVQIAANFFKKANIGDNIGDNIRDNIGDNIRDNIWDNIGDNIWANIRDNIRDNNIEYFETSWYGNISDYAWVAWVDYFLKLKLINSDRENDFNCFKELLLSGVFEMIQLDGMCIVSDMPTSIMRDSENRLHSLENEAILFKDGYGQHYIHGRFVPVEIFESVKNRSFTAEQFFKIENEEVKSAAISMMQELFGEDHVFNFFRSSLSEVDTYVDKKEDRFLIGTTGGMNIGVYTLFKGRINDEDVGYVRCYCPSTDRMFFLGVDPSHSNAKDAIASLYRVPRKLKGHIKYIQRQGERFSTVFDSKGTELLKNGKLSKSEISDTATVTGDQYFSLLKFEY